MTFRQLASLYADIRMARILFIGFISGFPWLLIASMLVLWLKEEDLSRSSIGLFGLAYGVYAVNALWAPFVDKLKIPWLHGRFGQRRSWILLMQAVIAVALVGMFLLPGAASHLWWVALFIFIIACASATQDVAIDALRIEMIGREETHKIGAGSAMATSGWWLGFGGSKVIALPFVEWLQESGAVADAWQAGYLAMVGIVALSVLGVIGFLPARLSAEAAEAAEAAEVVPAETAMRPSGRAHTRWLNLLVAAFEGLYKAPILAFITRHTLKPALLLLLFIIFFKIGEAFLGRMSLIFYKEIGFSKSDIALLSGGLGTVTVCIFAIFGSFINARYGLLHGIVLGGLAMASTNLLFAALAYYPQKELFIVAVVADQFTTSVSTVALVAFISQLCDRQHTATHYAALASLGNLSRTVFAAGSGFVVDQLEHWTGAAPGSVADDAWALFFILTMVAVLPSLFILYWVRPHIAPLMRDATTRLL